MMNNKDNLFKIGIERETVRIDNKGNIANSKHPKSFGNKLCNPFITTDFAEAQIELITPSLNDSESVYNYLNNLYDVVVEEIGEELLWTQSMPPILENKIDVAEFCDCEKGRNARDYRLKLANKYGLKKQAISGIHFNISLTDSFLNKLNTNNLNIKEFKNDIYLKIARNYLRYRFLIIYLFGSTSVLHKTYDNCEEDLKEINKDSYSKNNAISFRNSKCGYKNLNELFLDYSSVQNYITSVNKVIDSNEISSHKEIYSAVRLKTINSNDLLNSLEKDGIEYLEFRSIDVNVFDKLGISLNDLEFLKLFTLFLINEEESNNKKYQEESFFNEKNISLNGHDDCKLKFNQKERSRIEFSLEILNKMNELNKLYKLIDNSIIKEKIKEVKNYKLTYSYRIVEKVKMNGYAKFHLDLATKYKKDSINNKYNYHGYNDLELSTKILLKEALKKGIKSEVIDEEENFIKLSNNQIEEYVIQATKTSKDNYASILKMENKVITKRILAENNINTPKGFALNKGDNLDVLRHFTKSNIVVKPKSTNFGIGISILKKPSLKELKHACHLAFKHDNTILIEEYIQGLEYRFLVINDKVIGVLHRESANVIGDGINSIKKLIAIKNKDQLRGTNYKKPLEKIKIDDVLIEYLKTNNFDLESIPKMNEKVYLRKNSNISTGGDSIDQTDEVNNYYKDIALKAAKSLNVKITGIDMIIKNIKEVDDYAIIEANFNPAIHIHTYPFKGKKRDSAGAILKLLKLI